MRFALMTAGMCGGSYRSTFLHKMLMPRHMFR